MRQIFSIRFFAAVGAVVGLFAVLWAVFQTGDVIEGGGPSTAAPTEHAIDLVDQIFSSTDESFHVTDDGTASGDTQLVIDGSRWLTIAAGTPGEQHCPAFGQMVQCAVVADLLGEAVVWFAIVPMNLDRTVELPAIDTLDEGIATLVNGWQLPYAPILDRRCGDADFGSYRELRNTLGDDFTSVYTIAERRLTAVVCGRRVAYAPAATSVPAATSTSVPDSVPATSLT